MALLTSSALSDLCAYIKRRVDHARFLLGSTWYEEPLESVTISGTTVKIKFMIEPDSTGTVTRVQLIDQDNQAWYDKFVSLKMSDVSVGFAYVIRVGVTEQEEKS